LFLLAVRRKQSQVLFMIRKLAFDEIVEAIDGLSPDEQADLLRLVHHRIAEQGRQRVVTEVAEARGDVAAARAWLLDPEKLANALKT
jgi:hypothetical protein